MEDISEKVIVFILRLSHPTIHRVINEELQDHRYDYSHLLVVLSFDEIRISDSYDFVYASPDSFMDILPSRGLKHNTKFFIWILFEAMSSSNTCRHEHER